jgi:hypothetical protein
MVTLKMPKPYYSRANDALGKSKQEQARRLRSSLFPLTFLSTPTNHGKENPLASGDTLKRFCYRSVIGVHGKGSALS